MNEVLMLLPCLLRRPKEYWTTSVRTDYKRQTVGAATLEAKPDQAILSVEVIGDLAPPGRIEPAQHRGRGFKAAKLPIPTMTCNVRLKMYSRG